MNILFTPGALTLAGILLIASGVLLRWLGSRGPDWGSGPKLTSVRPGSDRQWSRPEPAPVWPMIDRDRIIVTVSHKPPPKADYVDPADEPRSEAVTAAAAWLGRRIIHTQPPPDHGGKHRLEE